MNKLIRAAGMLSLGTASLAVQTTVFAAEGGGKPWEIAASLRGFYDDNIYTRPNTIDANTGKSQKIDSFGFEISPSVKYAITTDDTKLSLSYAYSAKYYEGRPAGTDKWDQGHYLNAALKHSFSPRVSLELSDRFAVAQEPEQLGLGGIPFRANGDNKSNRAMISGTVGLTERLGLVVGYRNSFFDYDDPAYKVALNRIENEPSFDLTYQLQPSTVLVAGYSYAMVDYDASAPNPNRDNESHFLKVGIDQKFSHDLTLSARVGAQITDYDDVASRDVTSPYADVSLAYAFTPASSLKVGLSHQHNTTDVLAAQDQESTSLYAQVSHAFTAKLKGKIIAQYQNSQFISTNAAIDGKTEDLYTLGVNLSYAVTANIALDASYYYDRLESPTIVGLLQNREFSRNRVFLGVRFSY